MYTLTAELMKTSWDSRLLTQVALGENIYGDKKVTGLVKPVVTIPAKKYHVVRECRWRGGNMRDTAELFRDRLINSLRFRRKKKF